MWYLQQAERDAGLLLHGRCFLQLGTIVALSNFEKTSIVYAEPLRKSSKSKQQ